MTLGKSKQWLFPPCSILECIEDDSWKSSVLVEKLKQTPKQARLYSQKLKSNHQTIRSLDVNIKVFDSHFDCSPIYNSASYKLQKYMQRPK